MLDQVVPALRLSALRGIWGKIPPFPVPAARPGAGGIISSTLLLHGPKETSKARTASSQLAHYSAAIPASAGLQTPTTCAGEAGDTVTVMPALEQWLGCVPPPSSPRHTRVGGAGWPHLVGEFLG